MKTSLALILLLSACGDNAKPLAGPAPDAQDVFVTGRAVIVAGDFVTPGFSGVMSQLDLFSMSMTQDVAPDGAIGSDPILRKLGSELFVVNRASGNNVTIFDAANLSVKEQLATGASSNPQDVATFANKLYLPAMGTAGVVVLTRGSAQISVIDLSALDPDGFPDCVSAIRAGNDIYVACELLDQTFTPRGPGKVAVIDALTNTHRATVTLANANPFGAFTELPDGRLVIPTVNFGMPTSGCLEQIQSSTGTPFSRGCLVQNSALGGYVVGASVSHVGGSDMLWMVVNNGDFVAERARLWGYDTTNDELWDAALTPEAQILTDAAGCPNDLVVVADKTMATNGVRVYEGGAIEKTTAPLAVGLRPQSAPAIVCSRGDGASRARATREADAVRLRDDLDGLRGECCDSRSASSRAPPHRSSRPGARPRAAPSTADPRSSRR